MEFTFEATTVEWRGPAPFVFLPIPADLSAQIREVSRLVTYGWGVIPVRAQIGETAYTTSLFPRGEVYFLPVKVAVQRAERVTLDQVIRATVTIDFPVP